MAKKSKNIEETASDVTVEMDTDDNYDYTPLGIGYKNSLAQQEAEPRIKIWVVWMLVVSALLVDILEMAITWLGAGIIGGFLSLLLSISATVAFGIIFAMLGVNNSGNTKKLGSEAAGYGRKLLLQMGVVTVENIPGLDLVPILAWAWTIGMVLTIAMVRLEDRGEKATLLGAVGEISSFGSPVALINKNVRTVGRRALESTRASTNRFGKPNNQLAQIQSNKNEVPNEKASPQNMLNLKKVA